MLEFSHRSDPNAETAILWFVRKEIANALDKTIVFAQDIENGTSDIAHEFAQRGQEITKLKFIGK